MIIDVLILLAGIALLVGGGEILVRGAAALAQRMGVSSLVIGLTVVAFGTSAPELAVNMTAAIRGNSEISFGNIIGSNIANIGLILGISGLVRPLLIAPSVITREIPMMLLATGAVLAMALDIELGAFSPETDSTVSLGVADSIGRGDGFVLLMLFAVFIYYTVIDALKQRGSDPVLKIIDEGSKTEKPLAAGKAILLFIGGLVGVIGGGDLTVRGAVSIAEAFGVGQAIIGLTIVAIGTSLPELVTSIMAVRRGHTDIAIGNVVGSNIFNLLLIMGTTASLRPVNIPIGGSIDLWVMAGLSVLIWPMAMRNKNITRFEAGALLLGYVAYMGYRVAGQ